eukprot:3671159-Rhodomonas_salina.1
MCIRDSSLPLFHHPFHPHLPPTRSLIPRAGRTAEEGLGELTEKDIQLLGGFVNAKYLEVKTLAEIASQFEEDSTTVRSDDGDDVDDEEEECAEEDDEDWDERDVAVVFGDDDDAKLGAEYGGGGGDGDVVTVHVGVATRVGHTDDRPHQTNNSTTPPSILVRLRLSSSLLFSDSPRLPVAKRRCRHHISDHQRGFTRWRRSLPGQG